MNYNYMEYDQSIEANIKVSYGLKLNKITRQRGRRGSFSRRTHREPRTGRCWVVSV